MKPTRRQRKLARFAMERAKRLISLDVRTGKWAKYAKRQMVKIEALVAHESWTLIGFDPAFDGIGVTARFAQTADGQVCTTLLAHKHP